MNAILRSYYWLHDGLFGRLRHLAFLAPLLMRLYLAPVMLAAGLYKAYHIDEIISWFGQGLGFPEPVLMAYLAAYTELVGGFCLLFGLAVRWVSLPLMITMLVAAVTVHWQHGWFTVAPSEPMRSVAKPLADIGIPAARDSLENSLDVARRLQRAEALMSEHGNGDWLTEKGSFAVINNGIEQAATYFIMLLALLFTGAGRWLSLDDYLDRQARAALVSSGPVSAPAVRSSESADSDAAGLTGDE